MEELHIFRTDSHSSHCDEGIALETSAINTRLTVKHHSALIRICNAVYIGVQRQYVYILALKTSTNINADLQKLVAAVTFGKGLIH